MTQVIVKEYLGKNIEFELINGEVYVNATILGESQKLADWKRSKKTNELIEELEAMEKSHRLIISENGKETWIHESLFLDFAQYINVKFKVWCQNQIATLIREGNVQLKPLSEMEMIIKIAEKHLEHDRKFVEIENKIDTVINKVTLESGKQRKIQLAVAKRVYDLLYVEYSNTSPIHPDNQPDYDSYLDNLKRKLFSGIYRDIKRKFGVASYKDIKVVEYEKALNFIENWIEDSI